MDNAAVSLELCDMDAFLAGVDAQYADHPFDLYDYGSTFGSYTVQQDLHPGDIVSTPTINGLEAGPLLAFDNAERCFDPAVAAGTFDAAPPLCQERDTVQGSVDLRDDFDGYMAAVEAEHAERPPVDRDDAAVIGYVVPLECLGLDPHDTDAFVTGDCPEVDVERILELISAESQRLAAAVKTSSARGQKGCRDAADDDDIDGGGSRGAPRRATVTAEGARLPEQLEPAMREGGSRQEHAPADREPVVVASTMKRDAATQVSEAQLLQEFGGVTRRDAATQVSEEEGPRDADSWRERSPVDRDLATPFGNSFPVPEVTALGDDPLQFEAYAAPTGDDFVDFIDNFFERWY